MMKENMDQLEQKLREEFDRFAREEEKALRENGGFIMPKEKKDELYASIREKAGEKYRKTGGDVQSADAVAGEVIDEEDRKRLSVDADEMADGNERGRLSVEAGKMANGDNGDIVHLDSYVAGRKIANRNLYAELSEEDLKALELGRKLMEQEAHKEFRVKSLKKKKRRRVYIGLVAALVTVLAFGVTSMGGAERVIVMVTQMVGGREVDKINSSEDNLIVVKDNEEEAYQRVKEEFGIEPVRIIHKVKGMKFQKMEFEEKFQTAEFFYKYEDETIIYLINASYSKNSLGIDVDDDKVKVKERNIKGCKMEIKEYNLSEKNNNKYSARFKYNELAYCLVATMTESDFEKILNNLLFP